MRLRLAEPNDAAGIAVIWNQIIRDTLATFTTAEKKTDALAVAIQAEPQRWHVAENDGLILGFACYFSFGVGLAMHSLWNIRFIWRKARAVLVRGVLYWQLLRMRLGRRARIHFMAE